MAKWNFDFSEFLNKTATVYSHSLTTDDMMGETESYAVKSSVGDGGQIAVSMQQVGGTQADFFARKNMVVDYALITDDVYDIDNGDRIAVDGANYQIVYKTITQAHIGTVMRIYIKEVS